MCTFRVFKAGLLCRQFRNCTGVYHFQLRGVILNRKAVFLPGCESSRQRTHARYALSSQKQRHTGAGGLVWSSAVEHHVAIAWNFLLALFDLLRVQPQCSGNRQRVGFKLH